MSLLTIRNINLCHRVLTSLLQYCKSNKKINWINVHANKAGNDLTVKAAIITYKYQFKSINYVCFEGTFQEMMIVRENSEAYQALAISYDI
eukprot:267262_1